MKKVIVSAFAMTVAGSAMAMDLDKVDWSKIPKTEIPLFYPGQSSYEWITNGGHKKGAEGVRQGKNCRTCHVDEEKEIGDLIISGEKLEPMPQPGKPGSLKVTLQAAYDAEYLYLKASWTDDTVPGVRYPTYVYNNGKWEKRGNHRGDSKVASGEQPAVYEDRIAFMIGDDRSVPQFATAGCWVTCHNDMRYMPNHPKKDEVETHPFWGNGGMKKSDIRKYLKETRTAVDETGGWRNNKTKEELDAMRNRGEFLDLFQWRAHRGNPINMGDDGYVAEYRNFDAGKNAFISNWDKEKSQPKWMLDPAKNNGKPALSSTDLDNSKDNHVLLDSNAVPFDPNYQWKNGDMLHQWLVTTKAEGSAADTQAIGTHDGSGWTVVIKRRLNTGNTRDDIALVPGQTYTIGIAVHDNDTTARWHYVSFPQKLSLGKGEGDIQAVALK